MQKFMQTRFYDDHPDVALEEGATAILNSACRAARMILDRRAELDRAGRKDTPLMVLAGEDHEMPAYYLHHMLLLDELSREEEPAAAIEYPHNQIDHGRTYDLEQLRRLKMEDERGAMSLMNICGFQFQQYADHSNFILSRFLLRRNIATRFVDAAIEKGRLDYQDSSTRYGFRACAVPVVPDIGVLSPEGMHVRNRHMMSMSTDFARESGARIVVIRCGANHVAGRYDLYQGAHGLAAQFRARAMPVIGMVPHNFLLPFGHALAKDEIFRMTMSSTRTTYTSVDGKARSDEAAYINPLLESTGLGHETLTLEERDVFKAHCRISLDSMLPLERTPL